MSKSLATVITNLLSAIPWIGQDFVQFVWGGLNTDEPFRDNTVLKILLCAENPTIGLSYGLFYVKIVNSSRRSLPELKKTYSSLVLQRLDAEDLFYAYLVGLFEGDGYFSVSKKGLYITLEIGIELSTRDAQLLYKIKSILGVGTLFRRKNRDTIIFRVRDKTHLKNFVLPIFDKYPMLSAKQYDYLYLKKVLFQNIILHKDLPFYERPSLEKSIDIPFYFNAWLVGFIEAESSFSIYKVLQNKYKNFYTASFEVSQTNGKTLLEIIKKYLSFTQSINKDSTNNYRLKGTSQRSLSNIISFLDKAPIKLLGYKKLQYTNFIKHLSKISRYNKIKIPVKY